MIWLESIPRLWLQMPPMIKDKTKRYTIKYKKEEDKINNKVDWMKLSVWKVSPTFGYSCHQIEKKKIKDNRKRWHKR